MTQTTANPIIEKLGISALPTPNTRLCFYPNPDVPTSYEWARISVDVNEILEFSVQDCSRMISAAFNAQGDALSLNCSTGLPRGEIAAIVEMFCEEARHAFEYLILLQ